jgi:UDP-3-O-[3-hydroxymyristoyl] glucosamine N-acyltransferase
MLSILKNAEVGCITYYVGTNVEHIKHLKSCTLYCHQHFDIDPSVNQIIVDDAQLEFYKLSNKVEFPYNFKKDVWGNYTYTKGKNCDIHPTTVIGEDVVIGDDVTIGPNSVIYSKTQIGNGTRIDANVTIGTEGMMWVWGGNGKVFLRQLGGVRIGKNCIIGSNSAIVRGSANEYTIIEDGVNMAPGCCIGHGTFIGKNTHLANNVTTGGSSYINEYTFIGSAAVLNPSVKILDLDVVIGAGAVVTKDIKLSGVYIGSPAKYFKQTKGKLKGIPNLRL